jgi:hypothetical protein
VASPGFHPAAARKCGVTQVHWSNALRLNALSPVGPETRPERDNAPQAHPKRRGGKPSQPARKEPGRVTVGLEGQPDSSRGRSELRSAA